MSQTNTSVTLPEGVSLQRMAQVLSDAWEVGSHQKTATWRMNRFAIADLLW
jgi:hypothetical protein